MFDYLPVLEPLIGLTRGGLMFRDRVTSNNPPYTITPPVHAGYASTETKSLRSSQNNYECIQESANQFHYYAVNMNTHKYLVGYPYRHATVDAMVTGHIWITSQKRWHRNETYGSSKNGSWKPTVSSKSFNWAHVGWNGTTIASPASSVDQSLNVIQQTYLD